jgi:hypothetical protein
MYNYDVNGIRYTGIQYTVYSVQCTATRVTVCSVQCTVNSVYGVRCTVSTVYGVQCAVCSVTVMLRYATTVYSVTVYGIQYSVRCTAWHSTGGLLSYFLQVLCSFLLLYASHS